MRFKIYIIFLFIIIHNSIINAQHIDSYVDSLFNTNIHYLLKKCKREKFYNPLSENNYEIFRFLVAFGEISSLNVIDICYSEPLTNKKWIENLIRWYKKNGCCITQKDYLDVIRINFEIQTFSSLEEYIRFQEEVYERIQQKFNKLNQNPQ